MKKVLPIVLTAVIMIAMFSLGVYAIERPLGAKEYNGHFYRYYDTQMSWDEAKSFCEQRGGHLVTISSYSENEFVSSLFSCESIWLGGNDVDKEGQFIWCTNEEFSYSNWGSGEPDNDGSKGQDYIHMYRTGFWDDIWDTELGFVCEWDSWESNTTVSIPEDAVLFNNHYYKFITLDYDWEMAVYYCDSIGGHLAVISSAEENEFVNELSQTQKIWLGGSDSANEGVFEWLTGEPFYYTNWASGEPNNGRSGEQDYIQMYADGTWDDVEYYETKKFVCEWDYCCISENGNYESHSFNEWITVKSAKCGQAGKEERICSLCGISEDRELAAFEHDFGEYKIVSGSKLIPPIVKERQCNLCGEIDCIKDWGYVWVTVLAAIATVGVAMGVIGYILAFKKK